MGWLCTLRALLPRPLRNWKLVKATAQLPASASQHNTTTQDFTSHAHRARRSNNAAVDRVGGLLGFRAHMEEQTIYRECTGECCPRHCHVVASIQYATWRYGSFQRVCAVQGFFLGWVRVRSRLGGQPVSSRTYPGYQGQRRREPCRCASGPTPQRVVCSLLGAETPSHERSACSVPGRKILCCRVILRHRAVWQRDDRVPRVVLWQF